MPKAEIITIGTELLLGEIQDTNTRHIARVLRNAGIDLYRTTIVGDNLDRIATVVREAINRSDIVLTTGGLGPTVDDPTRTAIAKAIGVETEFHPELWDQIQKRFARYGRIPSKNNQRQAYIPKGATAIENMVGTAPAFSINTERGIIISLPGVPREMEYLLDYEVMPLLKRLYVLEGIIKTFIIHTSGAGESHIDEKIGDLEFLSNPTVGLVALPGQIDIRVTAKADLIEQADKMIAELVLTIEERLGNSIFGYNETTIEKVVASQLLAENKRIAVFEFGMENKISDRLRKVGVLDEKNISVDKIPSGEDLEKLARKLYNQVQPNMVLCGILHHINQEEAQLSLSSILNGKILNKTRSFGGHFNLAQPWAVNTALDFIRKQFCIEDGKEDNETS